MAKAKIIYACQSCGYQSPKWLGRCPDCNQWNSLVEEKQERAVHPRGELSLGSKEEPAAIHEINTAEEGRALTGIGEFDRVLGGGLVPGSVILIGGDPGIGKSTLLTQATSLMARAGHRVVYISGEEAVAQVRLRAERLGLADAPVQLAAETSVEDIVSTLSEGAVPRLIVIDSIQTMWTDTVESAPGTVTQVRASAQALIRFAKKSGAAIILV